MNVLGVDASLNGTGLCRAVGGVYQTTVVQLKAGGDRFPKWVQVLHEIMNKVQMIDLVIIEDYAYAQHSTSVTALAELGGVIRWELSKAHKEMLIVTSSQVKKFATGKGIAPKNVILKEVYRRYKQDFNDDNAADAFILAKIGQAVLGEQQEPLTQFQADVIRGIHKNFDITKFVPSPVPNWE